MYARHSYSDAYADQLAGGIVAITAFAVVVGIWLLVQAFNLVLRVLVRYRRERVLWISLGVTILAWMAAALAAVTVPNQSVAAGCAVIAALATAVFLLICRIVELLHDDLFQEAPRPGLMLEKVLARPWWQTP